MNRVCKISPLLDLYLAEDAEDVVMDAPVGAERAVCYPLADTMALCSAADEIRKRNGKHAMFTGPESEMDLGGWYGFYIYVTDHDTVSDIQVTVCNPIDEDGDEGQEYWITLTEEERKLAFKRLNDLSNMKIGYTCNRLLDILRSRGLA